MQQSKVTSLFLYTFIAICSTRSEAQFSSKYAIGINLGTFIYSGDLTPSNTGSWKTPGFVLGLTGLKHVTPALSARLDLNFGVLKGDEATYTSPQYRQNRAFAFYNRVTEAILSAEWSPMGRERKLSPYLFAGVGYASMKITRDFSRFNEAYFVNEASLKELLSKDAETELPSGVPILPVGLGLRYAINRNFSLTAEGAHRFTHSDYIDGFSYSGNPAKKDAYSKISIGIRYSIGNRNPYDCPPLKY
jgi:uncharacterized protein DUF6089